MKRIGLVIAFLLFVSAAVLGQAPLPTPPEIIKPQQEAGASLIAYKEWNENVISSIYTGWASPQPPAPTMPAPPDILGPQAAAVKALTDYKNWAEAQLANLWNVQQAHEATLKSHEASMAVLQTQVKALSDAKAALVSRLTTDEAHVAALESKIAAAGNALVKP
jgi:hypothetical protein